MANDLARSTVPVGEARFARAKPKSVHCYKVNAANEMYWQRWEKQTDGERGSKQILAYRTDRYYCNGSYGDGGGISSSGDCEGRVVAAIATASSYHCHVYVCVCSSDMTRQ